MIGWSASPTCPAPPTSIPIGGSAFRSPWRSSGTTNASATWPPQCGEKGRTNHEPPPRRHLPPAVPRGHGLFAVAAGLAPYLARLGVSHLYASPIFAASPGSTHGYDVTDYNALEENLGGIAGFTTMSDALSGADLGLILDFVPNHMGVSPVNHWWEDVLRWGRESRYARHLRHLLGSREDPRPRARQALWRRAGGERTLGPASMRTRRSCASTPPATDCRSTRAPTAMSSACSTMPNKDRLVRRFSVSTPAEAEELAERFAEHLADPDFRTALKAAGRRDQCRSGRAARAARGAGLAARLVADRPREADLPALLRDRRPDRRAPGIAAGVLANPTRRSSGSPANAGSTASASTMSTASPIPRAISNSCARPSIRSAARPRSMSRRSSPARSGCASPGRSRARPATSSSPRCPVSTSTPPRRRR